MIKCYYVAMDRQIILIAHNLRSCHNVGSLLRTAEGLGVKQVFLTGYTPYPMTEHDSRLPHLARKIDQQIRKTALAAEENISWSHNESIQSCIADLRAKGYAIAALELDTSAKPLPTYNAPDRIALIVGREVEGIEHEVLNLSDICLQIPMLGKKESFNVVQAAAMALYHMRFV
jgi:23S rRNA (guanosine2251-2'-O)-methyltransferase